MLPGLWRWCLSYRGPKQLTWLVSLTSFGALKRDDAAIHHPGSGQAVAQMTANGRVENRTLRSYPPNTLAHKWKQYRKTKVPPVDIVPCNSNIPPLPSAVPASLPRAPVRRLSSHEF